MKLKALLLAAAAIMAVPATVSAQEAETVSTSVNFGIASDYIFRGVNQNVSDDPQIFAGIDLSYGIFYAGGWASNVDFGTKAGLETDIYAGFKPTLGPVTFDFGLLGYLYPQEDALNIWELKGAATYAVENGPSFTGSVFYSPEYGKDGPSYWYAEVAASTAIPGAKIGPFGLSVGASVGTLNAETSPLLPDYTNWKLGVTAATENGWAIDVFYTDTDVDNNPLFDGKGVIQLKKTF